MLTRPASKGTANKQRKSNTPLLQHLVCGDIKKINWSFRAFEGTLVFGCGKCQPDEDTFHGGFQLENYISFPRGFYVHVSCISKRRERVCARELSPIFCLMLHCIKCSAGFNAHWDPTTRKTRRFIIACGILNICLKVLFIFTYFQFLSITPVPPSGDGVCPTSRPVTRPRC